MKTSHYLSLLGAALLLTSCATEPHVGNSGLSGSSSGTNGAGAGVGTDKTGNGPGLGVRDEGGIAPSEQGGGTGSGGADSANRGS